MKVLMSANGIISLLFSTSFQFLWGLINALQIIVLPVIFYLPFMPPNIAAILNKLYELASFDFLGDIIGPFFNSENDESYSETFINAGLDGSNFIMQAGIVLPMFVLYCGWIGIHSMGAYAF